MDISVIWFRRDLRLIDNEAVAKACALNKQCIFVFVIDPWFYKQPEIGWLRVKFMFESLAALDVILRKAHNQLVILKGESSAAMASLLTLLQANGHRPTLFFNKDIQVDYGRIRDQSVREFCQSGGIPLHETNNYFLLHDESHMKDWWGKYYDYQYDEPYIAPDICPLDVSIQQIINRLPQFDSHDIAGQMDVVLPTARQTLFVAGQDAARQAVYSFLKNRVDGYRWKLSRPDLAQRGSTSLLGPHLAFGTISNRTVFQAAVSHRAKVESKKPKKAFDIATYLDRLRWRDSFTQRLWFHPELIWKNRFPEFDTVYTDDKLSDQKQEYLERWQTGQTGFPLLDAAMLELKHDGFINFRMRAMAATFLTINCGISWHYGARHFMNCLVDGDIAINHWQWQMQAGITNPLSPTFRIYSPTKNFQDRDSKAAYVHFWLPETSGKDVETILSEAIPMLDFKQTRLVNGKVISDLRKQVRERLTTDKGSELSSAKTTNRTITNYNKFTADRYKRYIK